jgi:autotransporter translocation and assembly factor TamB
MALRRTLWRILLGLVVAVVLLVLIIVVVVEAPWGRGYLRHIAERRASALLNADVTIGDLSGNLFSGATLSELGIERDGQRIVAVDRVRVEYSPVELLRGPLAFRRIALDRLRVRAGAVGALVPPNTGDGGRRSFSVRTLTLRDAEVWIGPEPAQVDGFRVPDVIRRLQAELSLQMNPSVTSIALKRLSFVGESPPVTVENISGTVRIAGGDLVLEDMQARLAESSLEFSATIENFRRLGEHHDEDLSSDPAGVASGSSDR